MADGLLAGQERIEARERAPASILRVSRHSRTNTSSTFPQLLSATVPCPAPAVAAVWRRATPPSSLAEETERVRRRLFPGPGRRRPGPGNRRRRTRSVSSARDDGGVARLHTAATAGAGQGTVALSS